MTLNRLAGLALIVAVVLGVVAPLPIPGGLIIEPADSANFWEAAATLGENASLAQVVTLLFTISFFLYWFGLQSLQRAFTGGSVLDRVASFALSIFVLGYAILVIEMSMRHILIQVLAHGVGGDSAEEQTLATTLFAVSVGMHMAFLYFASIGSLVFGWALATRGSGVNVFRLASYGMSITGLVSFIVLMVAQHVPNVNLHEVGVVSNAVLFFGALCILIIGVGIYQGRQEFVGEEAAA